MLSASRSCISAFQRRKGGLWRKLITSLLPATRKWSSKRGLKTLKGGKLKDTKQRLPRKQTDSSENRKKLSFLPSAVSVNSMAVYVSILVYSFGQLYSFNSLESHL